MRGKENKNNVISLLISFRLFEVRNLNLQTLLFSPEEYLQLLNATHVFLSSYCTKKALYIQNVECRIHII